MWKGIVGKQLTPAQFDRYVAENIKPIWDRKGRWRPSFVVLHNTGAPTLAQRPAGFTPQHLVNLQGYYRDTQKWSAGPHLFIDQNNISLFTPLVTSGVHSPSWNDVSIGVEMLGDYETDVFAGGQGAQVAANAVAALATIHAALGIDSHTLRMHHEDPKTMHKDCPGRHVSKADVVQRVHDLILQRRAD